MPQIDNKDNTLPQMQETARHRKIFSIGLPRCSNPAERRFPLTPEAVNILTERGFIIKIESGAADAIHYTDGSYTRHGAKIVSRDEALTCDIVIHLAPLENCVAEHFSLLCSTRKIVTVKALSHLWSRA